MKKEDLQEITVPDSEAYDLSLILGRHLIHFYLEVKQLSETNPKYLEVLKDMAENPDKQFEGVGSLNDLLEKEKKGLVYRVNLK